MSEKHLPQFVADEPTGLGGITDRQTNLETAAKVLNLAEAARFVRCSRAHMCNIVNGKVPGIPRLPSVRVGRRVLFRRESLEQWLQEVEAGGARG
jgi:excisionase family DNA binding protein